MESRFLVDTFAHGVGLLEGGVSLYLAHISDTAGKDVSCTNCLFPSYHQAYLFESSMWEQGSPIPHFGGESSLQ